MGIEVDITNMLTLSREKHTFMIVYIIERGCEEPVGCRFMSDVSEVLGVSEVTVARWFKVGWRYRCNDYDVKKVVMYERKVDKNDLVSTRPIKIKVNKTDIFDVS